MSLLVVDTFSNSIVPKAGIKRSVSFNLDECQLRSVASCNSCATYQYSTVAHLRDSGNATQTVEIVWERRYSSVSVRSVNGASAGQP
jgi:hypothetical protein